MARKSMEINLGIRGVSRVRSGFKGAADDADLLTRKVDQLTTSLERLVRQMQQVGQQRSGFAPVPMYGGAGWGPTGGGASRSSRGSLASVLQARQALRADPTDFDAQVRLARAEQRYQRDRKLLEPKTLAGKLGDALMTSRVGFGGQGGGAQLMPLVNRILPLFGENVLRIIGPLGLAAAGLSMLNGAARGAADGILANGNARILSGGNARDIAGLTGMGMNAGDIASAAARFRQRISLENGDPFAMQAAQEVGIQPVMGRAFGPQNEAGLLMRGLEGLRRLRGNRDEQLRVARQLELDQYLPLVNVSDPLWKQMRGGLEQRARGIAGGEQGALDLQGSENFKNQAMENAGRPLGRAYQGFWTWFNRGVGSDLNDVANGGFRVPFTNFHLGNQPKPGDEGETQKDLLDKNTRAIEKLTRVVERGNNGLGARGSAATRLDGPALSELIRSGAYRGGDWTP